MNHPTPNQAFGPLINRISDVMIHTNRYASKGVDRLSRDTGLAHSSLSRIINNEVNPSFRSIERITKALERELGRHLEMRDLMSEGGGFLTPFSCDLCGCRGCLPSAATDEFGDVKQTYSGITPGHWVTSRFPRGFTSQKEGQHGN
jgi:hypothetical protein